MPKKRPATPKKLPKGLMEFEGTLEFGEFENLEELMARLRDLPEFGMQNLLGNLHSAINQAVLAEAAARNARVRARDQAAAIWQECVRRWTIKELQEATGYDNQ